MKMRQPSQGRRCGKVLCFAPKILAVLFIIFISLFSFDAFNTKAGLGTILLSFLIYLIPSIIVILLLIYACRNSRIGGTLFILLGMIFTLYFKTYTRLSFFLAISGPVFLIGILFLVGSIITKKGKRRK